MFWRPFSSIQSFYLRFLDNNEITNEATLEVNVENPHPSKMTFWDEIYGKNFLDADSTWEWTNRDENDEDEDGSGDGNGDENGDGNGDGSEDGNGDGNGDEGGDVSDEGSEEEDDDTTNSASAAAGYTFTIITLFSILNKFQSSQMLS